ncbi:hypothetical protein [Hymenobacter chitinivorans]|uniref:Uncharacterized protein n=1 Tax=Hymenobacter chitinivorans DSM 11115 TaxID=1121954 RepID=A0A2M9BP58_9BACT|nr:hypothetical protein [Hymenobacter chitinivorans]PJJ59700.1 hypothetical protein CLV45_1121 [Hymenobacter chitinivorans DSM 11115]
MRPFRLLFSLVFLLVASLGPLHAQVEAPAAANKRLFDRTVDELNFRTMETVYDKSFTRNKFPVTLRSHQARKQFDGFGGNANLRKLFLNYNDVSERFKNRFGKGRTDLAEFDKQLNALLIDKNFEFFIRVLPRDERVALIRSLQRNIKQASAQFNASEDPNPEDVAVDEAAVPPADIDAIPTTTATVAEDPTPQPETPVGSLRAAAGPSVRPLDISVRHDWVDYLALLLSAVSTLLLFHIIANVLPDLRARLDGLAEELEERQPTDASRPRKRPANSLPQDRYGDEDDPE